MLNSARGAVFGNPSFLAPPSQVYVPLRAQGCEVIDNGGDRVALCFTPEMAARIADLMNKEAGL